MTRLLVFSEELVLIDDGQRRGSCALADVPAFTKPGDSLEVLVVEGQWMSFAAIPNKVEETFAERLPGAWVRRAELIDDYRYQGYAISSDLLEKIFSARGHATIAAILPYAAAITKVNRGTDRSRLFSEVFSVDAVRVTLDVVGDQTLLTIARGRGEILACRRIEKGQLRAELFRSFQAARVETAEVFATDADAAREVQQLGHRVEVRETAELCLGFEGFARAAVLRFHTDRQAAALRAQREERLVRVAAVAAGVLLLGAGASAIVCFLANRSARVQLAQAQVRLAAIEARVGQSYLTRGASALKQSQPYELTRLWADLEYNLPKQFLVSRLEVGPGRLHAEITRIKGSAFLDHYDLGRALSHSVYFSRAVLRPQEKILLSYSLDPQ